MDLTKIEKVYPDDDKYGMFECLNCHCHFNHDPTKPLLDQDFCSDQCEKEYQEM